MYRSYTGKNGCNTMKIMLNHAATSAMSGRLLSSIGHFVGTHVNAHSGHNVLPGVSYGNTGFVPM